MEKGVKSFYEIDSGVAIISKEIISDIKRVEIADNKRNIWYRELGGKTSVVKTHPIGKVQNALEGQSIKLESASLAMKSARITDVALEISEMKNSFDKVIEKMNNITIDFTDEAAKKLQKNTFAIKKLTKKIEETSSSIDKFVATRGLSGQIKLEIGVDFDEKMDIDFEVKFLQMDLNKIDIAVDEMNVVIDQFLPRN
jgi:hypothetical protein